MLYLSASSGWNRLLSPCSELSKGVDTSYLSMHKFTEPLHNLTFSSILTAPSHHIALFPCLSFVFTVPFSVSSATNFFVKEIINKTFTIQGTFYMTSTLYNFNRYFPKMVVRLHGFCHNNNWTLSTTQKTLTSIPVPKFELRKD